MKDYARKKKRTVDELTKNLPVKEIGIDFSESRLTCDKCGGTFKLIRRELIIIPQTETILEYYRCTYACDKCEKDTGYAHIITTKTPSPLMKHSLASPSSGVDIMAKKYADGLPLARQEKIWAREGCGTEPYHHGQLGDPVQPDMVKAFIQAYEATSAEQSVIHADETVVQMLKEDGKPATSES